MKTSNRRSRDVQRIIHLVGGAVIGTYIYSPWGGVSWFAALVQWIVIPLLVVTGLVMWQWPRVRRLLNIRHAHA